MILLLPILVFFVAWAACFGILLLLGWWIARPTNPSQRWGRGEIVVAAILSTLVALGALFNALYGGG